MRRRDVIRQLGAAGAAVGVASGLGSAQHVQGVRWQFDDGHTEELTLEAFENHPETPSVAAISDGGELSLDCCCCGGIDCVLCYKCPDDCVLAAEW